MHSLVMLRQNQYFLLLNLEKKKNNKKNNTKNGDIQIKQHSNFKYLEYLLDECPMSGEAMTLNFVNKHPVLGQFLPPREIASSHPEDCPIIIKWNMIYEYCNAGVKKN